MVASGKKFDGILARTRHGTPILVPHDYNQKAILVCVVVRPQSADSYEAWIAPDGIVIKDDEPPQEEPQAPPQEGQA